MEPNTGTSIFRVILGSATPLILLLVLFIRFFQRRRQRGRGVPGERQPESAVMRRRDRAITDPERVDNILASAGVCRIAMAADDEPYLVPLNYGMADQVAQRMRLDAPGYRFVAREGGLRIYLHAATDGRKLDMVRSNSRVCFEVEGRVDVREGAEPCDWSVAYESVIGFGRISEVRDPGEKRVGLECLMKQNGVSGPFDFPDSVVDKTTVLRLDLTELTGKTNRAGEDGS